MKFDKTYVFGTLAFLLFPVVSVNALGYTLAHVQFKRLEQTNGIQYARSFSQKEIDAINSEDIFQKHLAHYGYRKGLENKLQTNECMGFGE